MKDRAEERKAEAVISADDLPLAALLAPDAALALITGVEGPSYRPLGATMAIPAAGPLSGNLSSGCIEEDLARHGRAALRDGACRHLRYGRGSPFRDLELPCGGGLDVLIVPQPDRDLLRMTAAELEQRRSVTLSICPETGAMRMGAVAGWFILQVLPRLRLLVFGRGAEARAFAALAEGLGYALERFSPGEEAHPLTGRVWPEGLVADARSAVVLFFHDHDWEPPILEVALASPAFFVGAQGSMRAAQARGAALLARNVPAAQIARLRTPFGLIASVRDPRTMAVSVMADVLAAVPVR